MKNFIKKTTNFILHRFTGVTDFPERVTDPSIRQKYAYLEAWISIIGNLLLAGIKVFFGIILNSISLLADAAHTASDVLTSIVVLLGFKISSSPADEKHPYGHGRIEFIASLIIAVMLTMVGVEFGKTSYERFILNAAVKGSFGVSGVMIVGALFKEWMAQFSEELGRRTNATALIADAWHHRTDAIASVMVAFAIFASKYGYYKVDAVLGMVVSALIIYTGVGIALGSVSKIIGEVPDEAELKAIENLALSVSGVTGVHKIKVHDYGAYKEISLHINLDKGLSLIEAHDISEKVEKVIERNIASKVIVHMEPLLKPIK